MIVNHMQSYYDNFEDFNKKFLLDKGLIFVYLK
jgi:hypothetical protein